MSLIRWSPFLEPFESFDTYFNGKHGALQNTNGLVPAIDVSDRADTVVIETALPGLDPKNVAISIDQGVLTISGSSERKTEIDEKEYYRKEIRCGSFMRQVVLPSAVAEGEAKASFKDGILMIAVPKLERASPKKISIHIDTEKS